MRLLDNYSRYSREKEKERAIETEKERYRSWGICITDRFIRHRNPLLRQQKEALLRRAATIHFDSSKFLSVTVIFVVSCSIAMQRDARCHTMRHNLSQRGRERIPKSDCGFYKAKWKKANESEHMGMDQVFTVLSFSLFLALTQR